MHGLSGVASSGDGCANPLCDVKESYVTEMPSDEDDALHEALWIALMCCCDGCGTIYDLDNIDHLADEDTWRWANEAVLKVKPLGWTSPHGRDWRGGALL